MLILESRGEDWRMLKLEAVNIKVKAMINMRMFIGFIIISNHISIIIHIHKSYPYIKNTYKNTLRSTYQSPQSKNKIMNNNKTTNLNKHIIINSKKYPITPQMYKVMKYFEESDSISPS
jgi:hypothetical protein